MWYYTVHIQPTIKLLTPTIDLLTSTIKLLIPTIYLLIPTIELLTPTTDLLTLHIDIKDSLHIDTAIFFQQLDGVFALIHEASFTNGYRDSLSGGINIEGIL